jgi:hypothetical protein
MKYFTPELYQQFNSFDVERAERADEDWNSAEVAYKKQLASIRKQMPASVVRLSKLNLHDALVVSREVSDDSPVAIISIAIGKEIISLIYFLSSPAISNVAPKGWRFSKLQEQWLYDEVDMANERGGLFVHRILFSTGVRLEITFESVIIHKFRVPAQLKFEKQRA